MTVTITGHIGGVDHHNQPYELQSRGPGDEIHVVVAGETVGFVTFDEVVELAEQAAKDDPRIDA